MKRGAGADIFLKTLEKAVSYTHLDVYKRQKYNRQILMLWGPQSDLARDPRWGRGEEVYGEDAFLNGTMAVAFIKGLQGDDPKYWQAAALLKHFLANSNEDHRNISSSDFDERLFWEYYSVPFRMGFLEGGARAVMASYNAWNGTTMAVNPILRSCLLYTSPSSSAALRPHDDSVCRCALPTARSQCRLPLSRLPGGCRF